MKLIIDIPDNDYELVLRNDYSTIYKGTHIAEAVKNGTLLPEHHGRLISEEDMLSVIMFSKLFDDAKVGEVKEALLNIPTIIERSDADEDSN